MQIFSRRGLKRFHLYAVYIDQAKYLTSTSSYRVSPSVSRQEERLAGTQLVGIIIRIRLTIWNGMEWLAFLEFNCGKNHSV